LKNLTLRGQRPCKLRRNQIRISIRLRTPIQLPNPERNLIMTKIIHTLLAATALTVAVGFTSSQAAPAGATKGLSQNKRLGRKDSAMR
jgi:hypothetical protein